MVFSKQDFDLYFDNILTTRTSLDILQYNGRQYVGRAVRGAETSNTTVAGANSTAIGADKMKFTFFTFGTTASYYEVTGFETLNGATVDGNWTAALYQVNANPPTLAPVNLLAWSSEIAQAGTSAIQRNSRVTSHLIRGGTIVGAGIWTASATGTYGTTTVSSANNEKGLTYTADIPNGNTTAWTATTEEPYVRVYYRPVLGV